MIKAEEARKKIDALKIKAEMELAETLITRAIEKCDTSCLLGFYVSYATLKWLDSLGYQVVRINNERDGKNTKVVW